MRQPVAVQQQNETKKLSLAGALAHTAVNAMPGHTAPGAVHTTDQQPRFDHEFTQAPVQPTAPLVGRDYATVACPIFPRTCPFGGACHTCPARVQARLMVNEPGDEYEQEADRMADRVMRTSGVQLQRRSTARVDQIDVPPIVYEVLQSPGQPLDRETREYMEPHFGLDLNEVRVHTDTQAADSARMVSASAYTVGQDIIFDVGQYAPATTVGRALLAHELTHVVQQLNLRRTPDIEFSVNRPADSCEKQVSRTAITARQDEKSYSSSMVRNADGRQCHPSAIQRMSRGIPQGNAIVSTRKADYERAVSAGKYCRDIGFSGWLHSGDVCYREVPPRSRYTECPPGDQVCFDAKTGSFKEDSWDKVSPVEKQNPDKSCNLHFLCSLGHGVKDVIPHLFGSPGRGALTGGGAGLLAGMTVGGILGGPLGMALGTGLGAIAGAGIGALVGFLRR